ncbi:MAG: hypothetical protein ACYDBV_15025, partial [Nitrospiria bacterium]
MKFSSNFKKALARKYNVSIYLWNSEGDFMEKRLVPLGDLEFKAEDFGYIDGNRDFDTISATAACERANAILREKLAAAAIVYSVLPPAEAVSWFLDSGKTVARREGTARLVCIEEINP